MKQLYSVPGYPDAGTYMYEDLWDYAAVSVECNCKCGTCFCCRCLEKIREIDSKKKPLKTNNRKNKPKLKSLSSKKQIKEKDFNMRTKKIDEQTLAILSRVTVEGNNILLTCGRLDRKQYLAVNEVLANIGGKWNRKAKAHVFDSDPTERLESVLLTGEIVPPKKYGYFPTPIKIAEKLVSIAGIQKHHIVLEPSAGKGAIASLVPKCKKLILCELLPDNCECLRNDKFSDIIETDFLCYKPKAKFNRIVANPPFSYEGFPQADIEHVCHMWECLAPGGRLVSVMGSGVLFRENRKTVEFRELVEKYGYIERLPEGSFKESGTGVNTCFVVMDKPDDNSVGVKRRAKKLSR